MVDSPFICQMTMIVVNWDCRCLFVGQDLYQRPQDHYLNVLSKSICHCHVMFSNQSDQASQKSQVADQWVSDSKVTYWAVLRLSLDQVLKVFLLLSKMVVPLTPEKVQKSFCETFVEIGDSRTHWQNQWSKNSYSVTKWPPQKHKKRK